jgi:dienelactone hydrolase
MFRKEDVRFRFPAEGGIELSAWLFLPDGGAGALPGVTMAHGYAGSKYHGIEPMAEAFAEAGFGLWGTSFAGGHAIVLGATDRRLKAVVAQVPTIDGHAAGLRRVSPEAVDDLEALFAEDERAQLRGEPPAMQAVVTAESAPAASYASSDAVSFYLQPLPAGVWENAVADHDTTVLTDLALRAYERALEPKRLVMIEGGHFAPYLGGFETASSVAVDWFTSHL